MVKTKFKRAVSLVMAAVLSLGVFTNIGTTAYAASGTKSDVYIMQLPRSGDTNNNGKWGHGELKFMNGWYSHAISTDSLRAMGSYSGNIAYCIEPGTGQHTGDTLTEKNEDYRFGQAQHQATLNKAIRRIIRDCNDEQFEKSEEPEVLLPHFSCHSLRHTFTTRMCEAGVNIKVIQDALGHTDISTTLNIYTDVTKELKTSEFKGLDNYFKAQ